MAKKGGVQQLQSEINNDEEFEKFLSKDGLLVLDVYTDWCKSCIGMVGSLKKIKLEIGGDNLHLAICKSDDITALKRFRNKSEPTWLFCSHGKVTNLMFGTNVPKLMRMITEELELEKQFRAGGVERKFYELDELTPEEVERANAKQAIEEATAKVEREAEETKRRDYIVHVTDEIAAHMIDMGVTLFMPNLNLKDLNKKITEFSDKCELFCKEKKMIQITRADLEVLHFECDNQIPEPILEKILEKDVFAAVWKLADTETRPIEEVVWDFIKSVAEPTTVEDTEEVFPPFLPTFEVTVAMPLDEPAPEVEEQAESTEEVFSMPSVWAPKNKRAHAAMIYLYFRTLTEHFLPPDPVPEPPHVLMLFDAYKFRDVFDACDKYPDQILATGFFTEATGKVELIAKTLDKYQVNKPTVQDKLAVKVAKTTSHCVLALSAMVPSFVSQNTVVGKTECDEYFPENYNAVEVVEEVVIKKKKKRRSKKADTISVANSEGNISDVASQLAVGDLDPLNEEDGDDDENAANQSDSLQNSPTEPVTAVENA